jgi:hypothetical protein
LNLETCRIVASEDSEPEADAIEPGKRAYQSPKIVKFGSIEALPRAGAEDDVTLADRRLQLIVERWKEVPEEIKDAIHDSVRKALG